MPWPTSSTKLPQISRSTTRRGHAHFHVAGTDCARSSRSRRCRSDQRAHQHTGRHIPRRFSPRRTDRFEVAGKARHELNLLPYHGRASQRALFATDRRRAQPNAANRSLGFRRMRNYARRDHAPRSEVDPCLSSSPAPPTSRAPLSGNPRLSSTRRTLSPVPSPGSTSRRRQRRFSASAGPACPCGLSTRRHPAAALCASPRHRKLRPSHQLLYYYKCQEDS